MRWSMLSLCLVPFFLAPASGTIYVVNPEGTGDFPTIQAAIDAVVDGDIIELTDGTFTGDGNRDVDYLGKAITVRSQSANPEACVIDCEGSDADRHRGFYFHSGENPESMLEGVTITNAYTGGGYGSGAGICCDSCSPTVTGCIFLNNIAGASSSHGGGMLSTGDAYPRLTNCIFRGNASGHAGGGLAAYRPASVIVEGCEFTENHSQYGGAVYLWSGEFPALLVGCAFHGNSASSEGGAVKCYQTPASISDCSFAFNSGISGGAVYCQESSLTIEGCVFESNSGLRGGAILCEEPSAPSVAGCTFVSNAASGRGGGVALLNCSSTFTGCTFSGNAATVEGGGFYLWNAQSVVENTIIAFGAAGEAVLLSHSSTANLTCCDLYGNSGGDWVGGIEDQLGTNGNIAMDPRFCGEANPEEPYTLWSHSPCAPFTPPNPECGLIGAWGVGCDPQDVEKQPDRTIRLSLSANVPNPFGATTQITYMIPAGVGPTLVRLNIHDVAGRLVRTLVAGADLPGSHGVIWDGTDRIGTPVQGGVYFCCLTVGDQTLTRRMVVLR